MDERDYEPEDDPRMPASGPVRRSGAVTAVAVVNFVVGGLLLILGLVIMIAGPAFIGMALSSVDPKDLTPEQYVRKVETGEISDLVLSFQLREGFVVRGVLRNYVRDPRSPKRQGSSTPLLRPMRGPTTTSTASSGAATKNGGRSSGRP